MLRQTAFIFITLYQWILSPLLGPSCRFLPSCSDYAREAFATHPPFAALLLSAKRLFKCHPFGPHGCDPVPSPKESANP